MVGFDKKTIRDVELKSKRVLLRADYNVPLKDGQVVEDYRLQASLPTIKYLLDHGCDGLVIISHLGRLKSHRDSSTSLKPVAERLEKLLGRSVRFADDCIGDGAKRAAAELPAQGILVLENLRFYRGEEADDPDFAKQIVDASGAQIFVEDGFGVVHRKHASTDAITKFLPSVAGLLLEKELTTIAEAMKNPKRPLTAVIGGAKISDKIELVKKFIETCDCVAVGGAMAHNFLAARRVKIGQSQVESELLPAAKEILNLADKAERERPFTFLLPNDFVVSTAKDGSKPTRVVDLSDTLADIQAYPKSPKPSAFTVAADERILDIGPISAGRIAGAIKLSRTVIWNGTLGITEVTGLAGAAAPFAHATQMLTQAIIGSSRAHLNKPFSLVGGGDTASYIEQNQLIDDFNFVSTGGGAFLELLAGKDLPGVSALADK